MGGLDDGSNGFRSADPSVDSLYGQLAEWSLQPLWKLDGLLTADPNSRAVPYRWPGEVLHKLGTSAAPGSCLNR